MRAVVGWFGRLTFCLTELVERVEYDDHGYMLSKLSLEILGPYSETQIRNPILRATGHNEARQGEAVRCQARPAKARQGRAQKRQLGSKRGTTYVQRKGKCS